jgi:hypothetical protein
MLEYLFRPTATPELVIFTVLVFLALAVAMATLREDDSDSPRDLFLRFLVFGALWFTAPLFNVLAWQISPRIETSAHVTGFNLNYYDIDHPPIVNFADNSGAELPLTVPTFAARTLHVGEAVNVTYLKWSRRAVALHTSDSYAGPGQDFSREAMEYDFRVFIKNLTVAVAVAVLGTLSFVWLSRRHSKSATITLAIPRNS